MNSLFFWRELNEIGNRSSFFFSFWRKGLWGIFQYELLSAARVGLRLRFHTAAAHHFGVGWRGWPPKEGTDEKGGRMGRKPTRREWAGTLVDEGGSHWPVWLTKWIGDGWSYNNTSDQLFSAAGVSFRLANNWNTTEDESNVFLFYSAFRLLFVTAPSFFGWILISTLLDLHRRE